MRVRVDEIPDSGLTLKIRWDKERLGRFQSPDDPARIELLQPLHLTVEIAKHPDHIRIQGRIVVAAQLVCHRCLDQYPWSLDHPFEAFLVEERAVPNEEEVELDDYELDYEFFDGEVIDLDQLIAEEILLALPFQSLCSEDCKGICPACGANRNREPCRCPTSAKLSAFGELKSIRSQLPEE